MEQKKCEFTFFLASLLRSIRSSHSRLDFSSSSSSSPRPAHRIRFALFLSSVSLRNKRAFGLVCFISAFSSSYLFHVFSLASPGSASPSARDRRGSLCRLIALLAKTSKITFFRSRSELSKRAALIFSRLCIRRRAKSAFVIELRVNYSGIDGKCGREEPLRSSVVLRRAPRPEISIGNSLGFSRCAIEANGQIGAHFSFDSSARAAAAQRSPSIVPPLLLLGRRFGRSLIPFPSARLTRIRPSLYSLFSSDCRRRPRSAESMERARTRSLSILLSAAAFTFKCVCARCSNWCRSNALRYLHVCARRSSLLRPQRSCECTIRWLYFSVRSFFLSSSRSPFFSSRIVGARHIRSRAAVRRSTTSPARQCEEERGKRVIEKMEKGNEG